MAMEASQLKELRKKQRIYQNILFVIYFLLFLGFLYFEVSSLVVFITLGTILILAGIMILITNRTGFVLRLFPNMKELYEYELDKLGKARKKYYAPSVILSMVAAVILFMQAIFRASEKPLIEQVPIWYFLVVFAVILYTANMNLRIHIRRVDTQSEEKLVEYAQEKLLFTIILSVIILLFVGVGGLYLSIFM
jgi:hypothetical protein